MDGGRAGGSCSVLARRPGVCVRNEDTQVEAGGALPEGRRAMPEGRLTKPEGLQARADTLSPAGTDGDQRAAHGGRASCGKHQWTRPERQRRKPEGRKVCQQAATAVASSPEAVTRELERRLREARARLLVREQARQWELWRRWAWCRGSCGAAVLQAGAPGMMARRRARAERVGSEEGWLFVAGWCDGLVPLGADMADTETNMADMETNIIASDVGISEVVAEDDVGRLGGSTGATGLAAEARAAERLRAAVRAWLARRRVAAEVALVRAECGRSQVGCGHRRWSWPSCRGRRPRTQVRRRRWLRRRRRLRWQKQRLEDEG